MASLSENIEAYEAMQAQLEADHLGDWVVFHDRKLIAADGDFQRIASMAIRRFGRGPFLLRRVGEGPIQLPTSLLYGL